MSEELGDPKSLILHICENYSHSTIKEMKFRDLRNIDEGHAARSRSA